MKWLYLILAIIFEASGTTLLKASDGLSKIHISVLLIIFYILSLKFFAMSLKYIEIGIAYALWSGIGIIILTIIGIALFKEDLSFLKVLFIIFIVTGAVGLNMINKTH
jgi:small multidrug resistance pump